MKFSNNTNNVGYPLVANKDVLGFSITVINYSCVQNIIECSNAQNIEYVVYLVSYLITDEPKDLLELLIATKNYFL